MMMFFYLLRLTREQRFDAQSVYESCHRNLQWQTCDRFKYVGNKKVLNFLNQK
jgi:hypothetical protein